ncbi:MAG TPA: tetratricopeptide repeat-containing glycosyltransferase family protein [Xanthobacteraceae bacterium]|nr:tetratricopeptide repeat-containing glycosyltransferase family protein [Xanthobacteraceae bacterium]
MTDVVDEPKELAFVKKAPPESYQALFQKAVALHTRKQFQEAEDLLSRLTSERPNDAQAWNVRGVNFRVAKRFGEAVQCYRQALAIDSQQPSIWSNLGNALKDLKHIESAIECHHRSLALNPNDAGSHHNLGIALTAANRHVEAISAFDRAIELNPNNPKPRWDRARGYLHFGDYEHGWPEYESRLFTGLLPKREEPGQKWDGSRYDGKRLLLVSEQGFGDAIWIARYLPQVKALGGELIMECRPELIPLIASMNVVDRLVPKADPLPDADYHFYQCSLPGLFTKSLNAVSNNAYIQPETHRMAKFAAAMERGNGKLRVGIVWSGSTTFEGNHDRAVSLAMFLQSFALPGVQLYSLQKGAPEAELQKYGSAAPVIDLAPLLNDFADTAAAIAQLDLVIMTDTAVAHLTGAIGKPVWVLLNFVPHWQWLLDRADSPWYSPMRLFRQRTWGDWRSVFDQASADLMRLVAERATD